MRQPSHNFHSNKQHVMPSGRRVIGVSHSWARAVDGALMATLCASPDLRHVAVSVPKAEGERLRLFHSDDGTTWRQVHLAEFGALRFDIAAIVRGAQELDGDPAFDGSLTKDNLRLREIAGKMLFPVNRFGRDLVPASNSLAGWVEARLRPILDHAATLYVDGPTSEPARNGRRLTVVTIERLIRHLRHALHGIDVFEPPRDDRFGMKLESDFKTFLIRRHIQFTTIPHDLLADFSRLAAARRKEIAKGIWADAARTAQF